MTNPRPKSEVPVQVIGDGRRRPDEDQFVGVTTDEKNRVVLITPDNVQMLALSREAVALLRAALREHDEYAQRRRSA